MGGGNIEDTSMLVAFIGFHSLSAKISISVQDNNTPQMITNTCSVGTDVCL